MPSAQAISWFMALTVLVNGGILLWLQIRAYRLHHHQSFGVLATSTVLALAANLAVTVPAFVPAAAARYTEWYLAGAALFCFYAVLGIWGVVLLFRSYAELAKRSPS